MSVPRSRGLSDEDRDEINETDEIFGARVRRRRRQLGWSTYHLAEKMRGNFSWYHSTVSQVEAGKRPVKLAEALLLAVLLKTSLQDLLRPVRHLEEIQQELDSAYAELASLEVKAEQLACEATEAAVAGERAEESMRIMQTLREEAAMKRRQIDTAAVENDYRIHEARRRIENLKQILKMEMDEAQVPDPDAT